MSLDSLLGNEQLKTKLLPALRADRLSHAYLLCGPDGSGKRTLARLLAAAMECTADENRPCCVCPQCRKVLAGTHPDVITVDDTEHKTVSVAVIRAARGDVYVRPNEGRRKVYILPRAADMGPAGQNALLKVIEEPPPYGAFLLLTDSAERLLPTIRSRSVELSLAPLPESLCRDALCSAFPNAKAAAVDAAILRSGGFLGQAKRLLSEDARLLPQTVRFAEVYGARDRLGLCELLVPMERLKRDQLQPILSEWITLLHAALTAAAGLPTAISEAAQIRQARSGDELLAAIRQLQRALQLLQGNVSPAAICGALQVQLR